MMPPSITTKLGNTKDELVSACNPGYYDSLGAPVKDEPCLAKALRSPTLSGSSHRQEDIERRIVFNNG